MKSIFLLSTIVFLLSCDTRKDFNANLNTAPQLTVRRDDNSFNPISGYQTTINDSLKLSQGNYYFDYWAKDNEAAQYLAVTVNIIGSGAFQSSAGKPVVGYVFNPNGVGVQSIYLKCTDQYGLTGNASINLTTFKDLPPIGLLTYVKTAVYDPLEYKIKADQSYDRDAKFGGKIINYEYSISPSYQVTTPNSYISYIFPTTGNYQVSLRVQDNDSIWSGSTVIYINVN